MFRFSAVCLTLFLMVPGGVRADEPRSRAGLWEFGVSTGASVIDSGFGPDVLGYRVQASNRVPPTVPPNLDTLVPTLGWRAGYNFTRFFGVELASNAGKTEIGSGSQFTIIPDFNLVPIQRNIQLAQQRATAPQVAAAYEGTEFDYYSGHFSANFNFNNRPESRWVFYVSVGGGGYSLDTDTAAFNECAGTGRQAIFTDATLPIFNSGSDSARNDPNMVFPDNPGQVAFIDPGCGRAFSIATVTNAQVMPFVTRLGLPAFFNSLPVYNDPQPTNDAQKIPSNQARDPNTNEPLWFTPPGVLSDPGFRLVGRIRSFSGDFLTAGGGVRFHFKPRQVLRVDGRRHFDEGQNKNVNEITIGYSFLVGKGRQRGSTAPPLEAPEDIPPPLEEDDADGSGDEGDGTVVAARTLFPVDGELGRLTRDQSH